MELTTAFLMWLIMGVMCFLLELVLPGFILFFFGLGAWITALACYLHPVTLNYQLLIFLSSSLLSLLLLRNFLRRIFFGDVSDDETHDSEGDTAEVIADIVPPAEGQVLYSGTQWRAVADERIEKGTIVTIVSQDGITMRVKKEA